MPKLEVRLHEMNSFVYFICRRTAGYLLAINRNQCMEPVFAEGERCRHSAQSLQHCQRDVRLPLIGTLRPAGLSLEEYTANARL